MMKFLIDFLGCKVNNYECECVSNDLIKKGYSPVKNKEKPDVIIINTCAVTETSSTKSKKMIRHYRFKYHNAIIVVMGCDAQNEPDYMSQELKIDILIGTANRSKIYDFIEQFKTYKEKIVDIGDPIKDKKYEPINLSGFLFNTRAYVKIQDGCDNYCTYCLIPYVRGRSRSRKPDEIYEEINKLVENGYKEIVLTGIDMCSYGEDFTEKMSFSDLLEQILIRNPKLYRLRISSIEESQIDTKFLDILGKYPNVADHLHIPLQSGSATILKKMNRKYDLVSYKQKIKKIREIRPDIAITTDVIVGFPGETDDDFEETIKFCKQIKFSKVHVFPYSDRRGTMASKIEPKVDPYYKKARVLRLLTLSNDLENSYEKRFLDKKIDFLFENYDEKKKSYRGHSSNYLEIYYKSDENLTNQVKKVEYVK
ncbi:MAG: tRNA (N(6)-L-threonylcarbamoyladenosine(37)-C(2))-methylthiotransferase MtaB [Bacilli bacterium]